MPKPTSLALVLLVIFFPICSCGNGAREPAAADASPALVTKTLQVTGMTCDGCEGAIQDAVGKMPGVVAVEANHEKSTTTVVFDTATVSEQSIALTIEELGYSVEEPS